ncbi:hypothetical protein ETAA8_46500 [Anatilimnocola aggregata]|uniref:Uncharacterized protein n=1 Tax=Anatilimnocola aggregata TaxID=2528021 RepID=A0A517YH24_9BACT|nr:hypothetical protein [Anatilimnocola aggregata]QDU29536.1 hypothetical protein ETAA8_46500 [Anatilimnocola aggregata]
MPMPTPEELDLWSRSYIPGQARCVDGVFSAHFNAVSWFPQATDAEIVALIEAGFKGEPVKAVARFLAAENPAREIEFVLRRAADGFEYEIDMDPLTSMAWIRRERPHLLRDQHEAT